MAVAYADRWGLVTGASSGIGAEFARRLAGRGMHLVLVARRDERLRELAEELKVRHGTRCEILTADLAEPGAGEELFRRVTEKQIAIELLVNCAGFGLVSTIEETDLSTVQQMIRLHIGALTELTYLALKEMLARDSGGIINVSSVTGFQPVAYMGVYSATKAFILHLTESLWAETRHRGVMVTAVCPGTTRTEFFDVAKVTGWLEKHRSQSPEFVVRAAIKGLDRRKPVVIPGWRNWFLSILNRFLPRRIAVTESLKYFRPRRKDDTPSKG